MINCFLEFTSTNFADCLYIKLKLTIDSISISSILPIAPILVARPPATFKTYAIDLNFDQKPSIIISIEVLKSAIATSKVLSEFHAISNYFIWFFQTRKCI